MRRRITWAGALAPYRTGSPAHVVLVSLALAGCVFGYRSEAEIEATYPLEDVISVRVDLPSTPLTVVGDAEALGLELRGEWRAAGGSAGVAKDNARTPRLVYEVFENFAELRAIVPLAVQGQVDLEVEELRLPPDRDVELRTALGDVTVLDVDGNLAVDVGRGDVDIVGGAGGIAVRTGEGRVAIESPGHLDVKALRGTVSVTQTGAGGNDVVVRAGGDVRVLLVSDGDLDLDLRGRAIEVHTGTVSTITSNVFRRSVGGGHVKIWVDAGAGDIEIRMAPP
jgi:hypothetical protein